MVKIERIGSGGATFVRDGKRQVLSLHQLITVEELRTVEAVGEVMYTIDETEIGYVKPAPAPAPAPEQTTAPAPVKPKTIVQPAPRKTAK